VELPEALVIVERHVQQQRGAGRQQALKVKQSVRERGLLLGTRGRMLGMQEIWCNMRKRVRVGIGGAEDNKS
jgi:hypothetical protein